MTRHSGIHAITPGTPILSAVALVCAAIGLGACSDKPQTTAAVTPEVNVMRVQTTAVPVSVELPGRVSAHLVAEVQARATGIVLKRSFVEGSQVKAGQLLYQIDPAPYIASLDSAKGALAKARATLIAAQAQADRYKVLVAANAVSKQDYDNAVASAGEAQADVEADAASVETAKINLSYTNVYSPISGRIGKSSVTPGAYVQSSGATELATVQQLDPVYVDLTQSSVDGLKLRRAAAEGKVTLTGPHAAKVQLILEDGQPYQGDGHLEFSDVTVDQTTGSVTVRATFDNPQNVLLPGMYVRARINEGYNEQAVLVPEAAVAHDQKGNPTALVVNAQNKIEARQLTTGGVTNDNWIIEKGLVAGDRVVIAGGMKVQPGETVNAVDKGVTPTSAVAPATASAAVAASAGAV
ncbi:MAG TPA: efflux RND transporter periplasmic adaptor subunit [Paraburkholderia sp.]|jgi:membrane fusion protein (multidrug efflux system)|uniref:efflux RND transporter periplasmic adaptor subunit n=1 Tax=Paraburkholderia sp. TaxID=1926495 RepID=UPI002DE6FF8D|nr:efflux RND transporter periplasmic adaptor subunit [Paraburkholderia sp.]